MTPHLEFAISAGRLSSYDSNGTISELGDAYAGNAQCLNDPDKTWVRGHGPIPIGIYTVGAAEDHPESVGDFALPLTPDPSNVMWDRSGFFIHGDNASMNHTASDGCIVASRPIRELCAAFEILTVVA